MTQHATETLDRMARRDDWLGHGYLGAREAVRDTAPALLANMDRVVLDAAHRRGLTEAQLFAWANSKRGRWFASEYGHRHATLWHNNDRYLSYLPA